MLRRDLISLFYPLPSSPAATRLLVLCLLLASPAAKANIALTSGMGAAMGGFQRDDAMIKTTGFAYGFAVNWQPEFGGTPGILSLGLSGKQTKLSYEEDHINKRATINTFGPTIGFHLPISEFFMLQLLAQYYPVSTLSALSTNSVRLNDGHFKYSTWESFKGSPAFEGRMNFTHDKIDGQFNRKNRFRSGIGVSYLQQSLNEHSMKIAISKDALKPTTTSSSDKVEQRLLLITAEFFLGLTF